MVKKNKAIFLDRDGVVVKSIIRNKKGYAPLNLREFKLMPDIKEPCKKLKKKGFLILIITNQPDLGKKKITNRDFNEMNKILFKKINFDKLYVSKSHNISSVFRKPNTGLMVLAKKKFNLDSKKCFMVGDRKSDIEAAKRFGCRSIFINRFYAEPKPKDQIKTVYSLKDAVNVILRKHEKK